MKVYVILLSFVTALFITSCSKEKCKANPRINCVVTYELNPVCGCDGITYENPSVAACAQVDVAYSGPCK